MAVSAFRCVDVNEDKHTGLRPAYYYKREKDSSGSVEMYRSYINSQVHLLNLDFKVATRNY